MTEFDKVIPPGSEGKVKAGMDLSHLKGAVEKHVDITTNDPNQPKVRLSMRAVVKVYVDVQPELVRFTTNRGQSQSQEVVLVPSYDKPVTLKSPTIDSDHFEVSLQPSSTQQQYKMKVSLKSTAPIGLQRATITVPAEGLPVKAIPVQVLATVRGPIAALPPAVSFVVHTFPEQVTASAGFELKQQAAAGSVAVTRVEAGAILDVLAQQGDWYQIITPDKKIGWITKSSVKETRPPEAPAPQTVRLQKNVGGPFKVLNVNSSSPLVHVEMDGTGDGKFYNLKVWLADPKAVPPNPGQSTINVKTDDADQPDVSIPVNILVT